MMKVKVRDFLPEDMDTLIGFKKRSAKKNFPGSTFDEEFFSGYFLKHISAAPDSVKVVEERGKPIAYIWLKTASDSSGVYGRIQHVFVDSKYRGKGIAKMLMDIGEDYFRRKGIKKIRLLVTAKNKAAVSLYMKEGFAVKRYLMEKDL